MITSILSLRFKALSSFSNKVKQKVIRILHFNHRNPILGTMNPMQWPPPTNPPWSRAENIQLDFSIFFLFGERKGREGTASALKNYCQCFILKLLMKLDLAMSTFLDINYLLFKIIEGLSQKGVQAPSGLACEWVIPEKLTPTTEGMLENLTGEGVNSSGNLDCTHFSCYESLPKGYNECIQPPSPLGLSEKIAPWQPSQNHLSVILVSQQRREPFFWVHSSG